MSPVLDSSPVLLAWVVDGSPVEVTVAVVAVEVVEDELVGALLEVSLLLLLLVGAVVSPAVSSTGRPLHAVSSAPSKTTAPRRGAAVVRRQRPQNGQAPSLART